ncbi:MAG: hypothetical protein GF419_03040 [Ignavibacteriales bacterium]|nr:hypothetical protein [Ignavibacteriales bacterium]
MKHYIGIDGGGTKTHAIVVNPDGKELGEAFGGPSNFLIRGEEEVAKTLLELLEKCRSAVKFTYDELAGVTLGSTGAGRKNDAERMRDAFLGYAASHNANVRRFEVVSDARIALEGAFSGKPGSILIAGTGSIMFGKDSRGKVVRVGGFGRHIGDEGSGYALGRKALIAMAKSFDGRGNQTLLTNLIEREHGITTSEDLITKVYSEGFDVPQVAPLVLRAAEQGDAAAKRIVEEESDNLVEHIQAMERRTMVDQLHVAFVGGLASSNNFYSKTLRGKIAEKLPSVRVQEPDRSPAYGAALMAIADQQRR